MEMETVSQVGVPETEMYLRSGINLPAFRSSQADQSPNGHK
jgi:hypothetical protein